MDVRVDHACWSGVLRKCSPRAIEFSLGSVRLLLISQELTWKSDMLGFSVRVGQCQYSKYLTAAEDQALVYLSRQQDQAWARGCVG